MTKHTPGVWEVTGRAGKGVMVATEGAWIAVVYGPNVTTESEANARLIAAAPELLEALKECAEVACAETCDWISSESPIHTKECKGAYAVIAKAEGCS